MRTPALVVSVSATAAVLTTLLLATGCSGYKKLGAAYGNAMARWMPSSPAPAQAATSNAVSADAVAQYAEAATLVAQMEPSQPPVASRSEPAFEPPAPQPERPAPRPAPASRPTQPAARPTVTHTTTRAPSYPSSPFIAIYPAEKGSSKSMCRAFTASTNNQGACMSECRAQLMSSGSCTCNELERCPSGTTVVE